MHAAVHGSRVRAGAGVAKTRGKTSSQSRRYAKFTPPKTPWGEPDLRGIWPLNHLIATPLQRPEKYGDRRMMTEDEFAAAKKAAAARNKRFESGPIPQADSGTEVLQITSMISEPANGRFPELTPHGKELYAAMHGSYKPGQTVFDSPDGLRQLGSLHHARHARFDVAAQLQQRYPHHADARLRHDCPRNGP